MKVIVDEDGASDEAVVADGYFFSCLKYRSVDAGIISDDNFCFGVVGLELVWFGETPEIYIVSKYYCSWSSYF